VNFNELIIVAASECVVWDRFGRILATRSCRMAYKDTSTGWVIRRTLYVRHWLDLAVASPTGCSYRPETSSSTCLKWR